MGRPATDTASPSTLAPALRRWLVAHGAGDTPDAAAGEKDAREEEADEQQITPRALAALFEAAVDLVAEPHVALRLPAELVYRRYDAVALASRAAGTPEEVLLIHARYAPLVFPQLEARVEEQRDALVFSAHVRGHPRGLGAPLDEYLVACVLERCRGQGAARAVDPAEHLVPQRVSIVSARPRDLTPLYDAFGTREIAFGCEATGFELACDAARRRLPGADPALVATAEQLAAQALDAAPRAGAFRQTVAAKVEAALGGGGGAGAGGAGAGAVSADAIATTLHLSSRTLQRRLEAEGTRFSEVLDHVREHRARRLLEDPTLPLAEIAYRAGFADLATFSRAFKRWTGVPPGTFRRARLVG